MMTPNIGTLYMTKIAKGKIAKNEYVKVSNPGDWSTRCKVKDEHGNEEEYMLTELMGWGYIDASNTAFDLTREYDKNEKDPHGNSNVRYGRVHITKNVRGAEDIFSKDQTRYCEPCDHIISYMYKHRELSDQEVVDTLLNDILYGAQPNLQSSSLVGTSLKGLDKDPNYHDGHYHMLNGKDYTMTWCRGKVFIREGIDGGWYHDSKTAGHTIYEGEIDWDRFKKAVLRNSAIRMLRRGKKLVEEFPEIADIIVDRIKDEDSFKLHNEFPENERQYKH